MKRHLSAFFVVCCLLMVFGLNIKAAEYGDYEYEVKNGTVTITEYYGDATRLTIPSTIAGKKVTVIGDDAFAYSSKCINVTIPYGVTKIGDEAFTGCDRLKSITIPKSVKSIGESAFNSCSSLSSVSIPNGITIIEDGLFSYCDDLTNFNIPTTVKTIGSSAFSYCVGLKSVKIPNSVTVIEDNAFENCSNLINITLSNGLKKIRSFAFDGCDKLKTITIPKSVTLIGSGAFGFYGSGKTIRGYSGSVAEKYAKANEFRFISLTPAPKKGTIRTVGKNKYVVTSSNTVKYKAPVSKTITSIKIPKKVTIYSRTYKVTAIGNKAFVGCRKLHTVIITKNIKQIGKMAFYNCKKLKTIRIFTSKLNKKNVLWGAFQEINKKAKFYVPKNKKTAYKSIFRKCGATKKMKFKSN